MKFFPLLMGLLAFVAVSNLRAANPFLHASDDHPVAAVFKGTEWGDAIDQDELPLRARVVTTRVAQLPWGAVFRIDFQDVVSKAPQRRELPPLYFIATDTEIVLLNEQNPDEAIAKLTVLAKPPAFEAGSIYGISKGARKERDGETAERKLAVQGDRCTYRWSHNSGHFTTVLWKKSVGLIEYAQGIGARQDGYRLTRESATAPKKTR